MAYSQYSNVTDELLSAYLDNAVTAAERALVEEAVAKDPEIAWRLEALRSTVGLLRQLAHVPLPRSFTLTQALLAETNIADETGVRASPKTVSAIASETASVWERWRRFWASGSPVWRNAAAVCALLLLVILVGDNVLPSVTTSQQAIMPGQALKTGAGRAAGQPNVVQSQDNDGAAPQAAAAVAEFDAGPPAAEDVAPDVAPDVATQATAGQVDARMERRAGGDRAEAAAPMAAAAESQAAPSASDADAESAGLTTSSVSMAAGQEAAEDSSLSEQGSGTDDASVGDLTGDAGANDVGDDSVVGAAGMAAAPAHDSAGAAAPMAVMAPSPLAASAESRAFVAASDVAASDVAASDVAASDGAASDGAASDGAASDAMTAPAEAAAVDERAPAAVPVAEPPTATSAATAETTAFAIVAESAAANADVATEADAESVADEEGAARAVAAEERERDRTANESQASAALAVPTSTFAPPTWDETPRRVDWQRAFVFAQAVLWILFIGFGALWLRSRSVSAG